MTNTINNVPRELLERLAVPEPDAIGCTTWNTATAYRAAKELRALLSAPSPAGVDGLVRNFKTREGYDVWDKLCAIPKFGFLIGPSGGVVKVTDIGNWIDRDEAQSVVDEVQCEVNLLRHEASDAQAIIDGLRGENEALHAQVNILQSDANSWQSGYDEGRRMGGKHCALTIDQHAQRIGELEGLLLACHSALYPFDNKVLEAEIDAALSAGKEGSDGVNTL